MKILIVFYSMFGHVYQLAEGVKHGVMEVEGAEVVMRQVPELVPDDVLVKTGAKQVQYSFAHIPVAKNEDLADADAIIFGTPTRFGMMCAQMRYFLDRTTSLWKNHSLVGKVGSVFVSTASQHGGQETTIVSFYNTLIHLGMVISGVPYSCENLFEMKEVTGGTPYGATTMADHDGSRKPSKNELEIARFQGKHIAEITKALKIGRQKTL